MTNVTAVLKIYSDSTLKWMHRKRLAEWLLLQRKNLLESGDREAGQVVTRFNLNPKYNRGRD